MRERDASEEYMDICIRRLERAGLPYDRAKEIQKWCGCTRTELNYIVDDMIGKFNQEKETSHE